MSTRRSAGDGNIRLRSDGRWEGRYVAGHDDYGKPIRKNVLGKTRQEVKEKLKKAIDEADVLDVARADGFTVKTLVESWYELYCKPNIRENTREYYERFIYHHIIPKLGNIKLKNLTTRDIQKFCNNVRFHGRQKNSSRGEEMSASYVRGLHRMLKTALQRAVKERLIPFNPAEDIVLPKPEKAEMKTLKPEDLDAFLAEADRRGVLPMFFLELCTGLRKGELTALLWSDLDVERRTLSVSKSAAREKGGGVKIIKPKTNNSIRTIPVSQAVVDMLIKEHEKHPDNPYMFPSPVTGGMYYPDAVSRLNTKILDSAGLEHIRMHDLRHTFATVALQNGTDIKTVSSMLGHADAGFTLRTYTHTSMAAQAEAADAMGEFMSMHL